MFAKKQVVYRIPVRWWESKQLDECTILYDNGEEDEPVYVRSALYEHNIFVVREDIFSNPDRAMKEIEHRRSGRDDIPESGVFSRPAQEVVSNVGVN